jgi:uncharacterized membrane protein YidH (DUF202 family)
VNQAPLPREPQTRDPGVQGERTALAWSRTSLAMLANSLLALRAGVLAGNTEIAVLALGLIGAAAATFAYGRRRRRLLLQAGTPAAVPASDIAVIAGAAVFACVVMAAALALRLI